MDTVTTPGAVADAAVEMLAEGWLGNLGPGPVPKLRSLDATIRSRLRGDPRAELLLADVVAHPHSVSARRTLAEELSYYVEVDSEFAGAVSAILLDMSRSGIPPMAALRWL